MGLLNNGETVRFFRRHLLWWAFWVSHFIIRFSIHFSGHVEDRIDTAAELVNITDTVPVKEKEKFHLAAVEKEVQQQSEDSKSTTSTTQPPSPILAFSVTFPPRPSSTLPPPPPPPTFFSRRFTPKPTARTTVATTPRSFNNKFNKPAINNLVGVPAPFATGIQS